MSRRPFVWDVHFRREVLDGAVAELKALPYSSLRDLVDEHCNLSVTGPDGKQYRVKIEVGWRFTGSEDIRVRATLTGSGWWKPKLTDGFVITPDNKFV